MLLVFLITFFIFIAIYRVVCVQPNHSRLGDLEDIFVTHLSIIIKSGLSKFPFVAIFSVIVCLSSLYHLIILMCATD